MSADESRQQLAAIIAEGAQPIRPPQPDTPRQWQVRAADAILASDWYAATLAAERERIAVVIEAELDDRFNKWRDVGLNLAAHVARSKSGDAS